MQCILFDRDGTLIEDKHYLADPDQVILIDGVVKSLSVLYGRGYRFALVSNQSGVGRKLFSMDAVEACNTRLITLLNLPQDAMVQVVYCPHAPEENCMCRKPKIGMWESIRASHGWNPHTTIMVGDKKEDILFANTAGLCAAFLVSTGKGASVQRVLEESFILRGGTFSSNVYSTNSIASSTTGATDVCNMDNVQSVSEGLSKTFSSELIRELEANELSAFLYIDITTACHLVWGIHGTTRIYAISSVAALSDVLRVLAPSIFSQSYGT